MLATTREMLINAQSKGYAVGAFNVENMEMVLAVIDAAEEMRSPVILQTTPSTAKYAGLHMFAANVRAAASRVSVPVALHLDHGDSFALSVMALREGYTSVMIDGSRLAFEENIALIKKVKEAAEACGIPVEAELGRVGGKEDDLECESTGTDPAEAAELAARTGIDSLAVAIGTAHGFYKSVPLLDKTRLSLIRGAVGIPLVMHGASGLSDDEVRACVSLGICKVNFATELRAAFTDGIKKALLINPEIIDPKLILKAGRESLTALVKDRIEVCGCGGRI